jgi:hypothetical protein
MSWLGAWFGYGFGKEAARAIFGEERRPDAAQPPIRQQTEAEIRADERRYDEDAKRLDEEDAAAKRRGAEGHPG